MKFILRDATTCSVSDHIKVIPKLTIQSILDRETESTVVILTQRGLHIKLEICSLNFTCCSLTFCQEMPECFISVFLSQHLQ